MGISVESIWSQAQRLSDSERLDLSRRLRESIGETEAARRERVASEIDRFFGGWSDAPRTTDEMMKHIRAGRTANTFPKLCTPSSASTRFPMPLAARNSVWRASARSSRTST